MFGTMRVQLNDERIFILFMNYLFNTFSDVEKSSLLQTKITTTQHILLSEMHREEMAEENMSIFHQSQISLRDASALSDTCRHTFMFQAGPVRAD